MGNRKRESSLALGRERKAVEKARRWPPKLEITFFRGTNAPKVKKTRGTGKPIPVVKGIA